MVFSADSLKSLPVTDMAYDSTGLLVSETRHDPDEWIKIHFPKRYVLRETFYRYNKDKSVSEMKEIEYKPKTGEPTTYITYYWYGPQGNLLEKQKCYYYAPSPAEPIEMTYFTYEYYPGQ